MMRGTSLFLSLAVARATSFTANTAAGRKLLEKAKQTQPHRRANDWYNDANDANENNWYNDANDYEQFNYNNNNERSPYYDLSTKSIKYIGCSTYMSYDDGQDQDDNGWASYNNANMNIDEENWWEYQMQANEDGLTASNMVRFTLCDSEQCNSKCSGEYVVDMESFVQAYTEFKMNHDSFWCERIRENCACKDGNSWYECYSDCFSYKGLSYDDCRYAMQNGNDNYFDIQEYLECAGIKFYNPQYMYASAYGQNNFNYQDMYYLGLTCTNNNVMLTGFYDEQCTFRVDQDDWKEAATASYQHIPYLQGEPIIASGTCVGCMDPEDEAGYEANDNDNGDNNGNADDADQDENDAYNWNQEWAEQPDATDLCMMMTGEDGGNAVVCDEYNQKGCEYIEKFLPEVDGRFDGWMGSIANLKSQLSQSKRATWALAAVVAVLLGVLFFMLIRRLSDSAEVKNRDALLEYRREVEAVGSIDTNMNTGSKEIL